VKNAKMAFKLLDDAKVYSDVIKALDNADKKSFAKICEKLKIPEAQTERLWLLMNYESSREAGTICW
jgi:hypothetical protein